MEDNIPQANGSQKKVSVAVVISGKIIFKPERVKGEEEGHSIMIKR